MTTRLRLTLCAVVAAFALAGCQPTPTVPRTRPHRGWAPTTTTTAPVETCPEPDPGGTPVYNVETVVLVDQDGRYLGVTVTPNGATGPAEGIAQTVQVVTEP